MSLGAVLIRDDFADAVDSTARLENVRHRGLRQAFQALKPGLLVCHPDTFQVRYANAAARDILKMEQSQFPVRMPETITMTCQQEYIATEKRHLACYRVEIDVLNHDARAFPVYLSNGQVDCVLVVIRSYGDVSWSLFEMLDRLPMAIAALTEDQSDVRYINRMALREIFSLKSQGMFSGRKSEALIGETLVSFLKQAPEGSEGRHEVLVGRAKVDMHIARLGESDGTTQLLYWDPRATPFTRH